MPRRRTVASLGLLLLGCGSDPTEPQGPDLSYLSLFPDRTIALVEDRLEFQVTARDLDGVELPDFAPSYTSSNPAVVRIDPGALIIAAAAGTATVHASAGGQTAAAIVHVGEAGYDLETLGPPRVLPASYIDVSKIERVSRFRSGIGHDYSFAQETCRSMKHYYQPKLTLDWTTVDIYAPASGTIQGLKVDGLGYQIRMAPRDMPWLSIHIFHVDLAPEIVRGMWIEAGDHLGTHASNFTMSDIAVSLGSLEQGTLISYFETMTDAVFAEYQARGVSAREAAIITKEQRDAEPLVCDQLALFESEGTIENWVYLD